MRIAMDTRKAARQRHPERSVSGERKDAPMRDVDFSLEIPAQPAPIFDRQALPPTTVSGFWKVASRPSPVRREVPSSFRGWLPSVRSW
jgi:hypothetical protein